MVKLVPFAATGEAGASTPARGRRRTSCSSSPSASTSACSRRRGRGGRAHGCRGRREPGAGGHAVRPRRRAVPTATDVIVNTVGGSGRARPASPWHVAGLQARAARALTRACAIGTALVAAGHRALPSSPRCSHVHVRDVGPLARVGRPGWPLTARCHPLGDLVGVRGSWAVEALHPQCDRGVRRCRQVAVGRPRRRPAAPPSCPSRSASRPPARRARLQTLARSVVVPFPRPATGRSTHRRASRPTGTTCVARTVSAPLTVRARSERRRRRRHPHLDPVVGRADPRATTEV